MVYDPTPGAHGRTRTPSYLYLSTTVEPDIRYTRADIIERASLLFFYPVLSSSSLILSESEEIVLRGREREETRDEGEMEGLLSSRFYPRLRLSPRLSLHIVPYTHLSFGILRLSAF